MQTTRRAIFAIVTAAVAARGARAEEGEAAAPPKPTFISLGEFTINLPDGGSAGYVVVGITLDVAPDAAGALNDIVPRLKDLVISRLMAMAAQGMLTPGHSDLVMIKTSLFDSISRFRPEGVKEVLITRLLYG